MAVLERLTNEERFRFLAFTTGSPSLPPPGRPALHITVEFIDGSKIPEAHTCFNEVKVASCESVDEMEKMVRAALESNVAFELP
jgi:hypothetical protein